MHHAPTSFALFRSLRSWLAVVLAMLMPVAASASTATTLSLVSASPAPNVMRGDPVLVEALIAPDTALLLATGTITIGDGVSSCVATLPNTRCLWTPTVVGMAALQASYSGDADFDASTSAVMNLTVHDGPPDRLNRVRFPSIVPGTASAIGPYSGVLSADGRFFAASSSPPYDIVNERGTQRSIRFCKSSGGVAANNSCDLRALSTDGRVVVFQSSASNLVPNDSNGQHDIFVRDLNANVTERISIGNGGEQANNGSQFIDASTDARYVLFYSNATNLVAGDTNGTHDLFVRDRVAGTTERVNVDSNEAQDSSGSTQADMTPDGRYIVFYSGAALVPDDTNNQSDIYLRDRVLGTTERISVGAGGIQSNNSSDAARISDDGQRIAFLSFASNLAASATGGYREVFVRDRSAGTTQHVSISTSNGPSNYSDTLVLSANGNAVLWRSYATNLVAGVGQSLHWYHRNLTTGVTSVVMVSDTGVVQPPSFDGNPRLSADGSEVVFGSGTALVTGEQNDGRYDVFVRHPGNGTTTRLSQHPDGSGTGGHTFVSDMTPDAGVVLMITSGHTAPLTPGGEYQALAMDRSTGTFDIVSLQWSVPPSTTHLSDAASNGAVSSMDGRYVAFVGATRGLTGQGAAQQRDVFRLDRQTDTLMLISRSMTDGSPVGGDEPTMSRDGRYVAFVSNSSDLVAGDSGVKDVFRYDTETDTLVRVSVDSSGQAANAEASEPAISDDGQVVAFSSLATNLMAGDINAVRDVFVRDLLAGTTVPVSVSSANGVGNSSSSTPRISADGRWIAFHSDAGNLVAQDSNGSQDVFLRDRVAGTTTRENLASDGSAAPTGRWSSLLDLSGDGRYLMFQTNADSLVEGDLNNSTDVLVRDLRRNRNRLISWRSDGSQLPGGVGGADGRLSFDGRRVILRVQSPIDLSTPVSSGIYVRDIGSGAMALVSRVFGGSAGVYGFWPYLSGDGRELVYESSDPQLIAGDINNRSDVFRQPNPLPVLPLTSIAILNDLSGATVVGESYGVQVDVDAADASEPLGTVVVDDGVSSCNITLGPGDQGMGSCVLTTHSPGTREVWATFDASNALSESDTVQTHPVQRGAAHVLLYQSTASSGIGEPFSVFALVSAALPARGTPGGTVNIALDGVPVAGCQDLLLAANCVITSSTPGVHLITASYSGDTNFLGGTTSAATLHTVAGWGTNTALSADIANPTVQQVVTLTAAVGTSPGGPATTGEIQIVDITTGTAMAVCSGSGTSLNCPVTVLSSGTRRYEARYAGDANTAASVSNTLVRSFTNQVPTAGDDTLAVNEDSFNNLLATSGNDSDPEGGALTLELVSPPSHGVVQVVAGQLRYTPATDWFGTDSLGYRVSDGEHASSLASVTINVSNVNDAPTFVAGGDRFHVAGATGLFFVPNWVSSVNMGPNESAQTIDDWIVTETDDPAAMLSGIDVTDTGTLTYTLNGAGGAAEFTVRLRDSGGTAAGGIDTSSVQTFRVIVPSGMDLQIGKDNQIQHVIDGQTTTYGIVVANSGPADALGARVVDQTPVALVNVSWSCTVIALGVCPDPASGSGALDATVDLPNQGILRFDVTGTVDAQQGAFVINTASVLPPADGRDVDLLNNTATDIDPVVGIGLFLDGFEDDQGDNLTVPGAEDALRR